VRNCYDGSVECELEGSERDIDSVIMEVEGARFVHIDNLDVKTIPTEDSRSFDIRH
jgi:acylphosphatase